MLDGVDGTLMSDGIGHKLGCLTDYFRVAKVNWIGHYVEETEPSLCKGVRVHLNGYNLVIA